LQGTHPNLRREADFEAFLVGAPRQYKYVPDTFIYTTTSKWVQTRTSAGRKPPTMARDSAGVVVNTTQAGLLVKAPRMLPIGTTLVDVRNQPVGRVSDVIGPVKAPFLVVKPGKGANPLRLLNREVFTP